MKLSLDSDMMRLQAHSAIHQMAIHLGAVFSAAFLLKQGLTYSQVFMTFAGVYALRLVFRPIVYPAAPYIGLRVMLIVGTIAVSFNYVLVAFVSGYNWTLAIFIVYTAFANMLYWTTFHAVFASAGETKDRGRQLGARQSLTALAGIVGPVVSGLALDYVGAWVAFGLAGAVGVLSAWPLYRLAGYPVLKQTPPLAWRASLNCAALFLSDGFLWLGSGLAWSLLLFERMGGRFDAYGFVLALAAIAGAIASLTVGHSIDLGHGRKAVVLAAIIAAVVYAIRAVVGADTLAMLAAVVASTVLYHFYTPTFMAAFYNEAKKAPCAFRLQNAAETGWDIGAVLGSLCAVFALNAGADLQTAIWLAMISILAEALLLHRIYRKAPA